MISPEDFIDWLSYPSTKAVMRTFAERIKDRENELGYSAGKDPLYDRYVCGGIAALKSVLDITWDDIEKDDKDVD